MYQNILHLDASFQKQATALGTLVPKDRVQPLDEMFEQMRRFTAVRRHEVRLARLEDADPSITTKGGVNRERVPDAVKGFSEGLRMLSEHAYALQPLIVPALDDVIALAADNGHPLRTFLIEAALSLGFSSQEADWLLNELKAIDYQPVSLVCANGFEDFTALLSSISVGEAGLLVAGFVRFSGDPDIDERLEKLVIRLREKGATASVFLALAIILIAHIVAMYHASR